VAKVVKFTALTDVGARAMPTSASAWNGCGGAWRGSWARARLPGRFAV